jgi:hypothetical protein
MYLLSEAGLDAISLNVNDGKAQRIVCGNCGNVTEGSGECSCGKKNIPFVTHNRWSKCSEPIYIARKKDNGIRVEKVGKAYQVIRTSIVIRETSSRQLEMYKVEETMAEISLDKFDIIRVHPLAIDKPENGNVCDFVFDNIDKFDESVAETLEDAKRISKGIFGDYYHGDVAYRLATWPSICHVLTDANIAKYKRFFEKTIQNSWTKKGNPYPNNVCLSMDDFWTMISLPSEYANFYASSKFEYSGYYWRTDTKVNLAALRKSDENLQKTLKSCIEHMTIGICAVSEIVEWASTHSKEEQQLCAKYMKKHGMLHGSRVFDKFQEELGIALNNGYPLESILQPRKLAMLEFSELLRKRGFPDSRVDAFCDIFDLDPEFGIGMLGSKAQLKKDEAEKIYKK